jgi:hypothetical protein
MKKLTLLLSMTAVAVVALCGAGCSAMDKLYDKEVKARPGTAIATNTVFKTNFVVVAATQNGPVSTNEYASLAAAQTAAENANLFPGVKTTLQAHVAPQVEVVYGAPTLTTNLVKRPGVSAGIELANTIPGWGSLLALAGSWAYGAYASLRNRKVKEALVSSVEAGRDFLKATPQGAELDGKFKQILIENHLNAGVADDVMELLDKYVHD